MKNDVQVETCCIGWASSDSLFNCLPCPQVASPKSGEQDWVCLPTQQPDVQQGGRWDKQMKVSGET